MNSGHTTWTITGPDKMAYNTPGQAPKVIIAEIGRANVLKTIKVPPLSVTVVRLNAEKKN